ncbi:MAG: tetratricopeptide repeat protein [Cyanobacteria bacterium SZAS LIN-3]|nr:tetratricopeptide repeat protein [Cyanobacteria bacterium SZAS LIN-3]MBS2005974.1 tetratricopeptide repeat protein [Cyanobacteria bacterium SZAS TMP-1]
MNSFVGDFPARRLRMLLDQRAPGADKVVSEYLTSHKHPNQYLTRIWKAIILLRHDEGDAAAPLFRQSLPLHDVSIWVKCNAAECFNQVEDSKTALQIMNTIPENQYDDYCYSTRAFAYSALHKTDLAVADYLSEAKLRPTGRTGILSNASNLYYREGRYSDALKILDQITAGANNDNRHALFRGYCLVGLKRYKEAIVSFTQAIESANRLNSENNAGSGITMFRAYEERARCYEHLGKTALALADRRTAAEASARFQKDLIGH